MEHKLESIILTMQLIMKRNDLIDEFQRTF